MTDRAMETRTEERPRTLSEEVHARSGVLEYDEEFRVLIWTDRLSKDEYGASAIVAVSVIPWFGQMIADLAATSPSQTWNEALNRAMAEIMEVKGNGRGMIRRTEVLARIAALRATSPSTEPPEPETH